MIKRKLFQALKSHFANPEITLLIGPRQSGKTTLLRQWQKELQAENKKTLFINLDVEEDKLFFDSQAKLLQKIKLEFGQNPGTIFIDEIQRKNNAGLFLKGLYDMDLPYKFIVSGSGSLELKEKIHESLTGRKRIFELTTLSFEEFVNFKTDYAYENNLNNFFALEKNKTRQLLEEYLDFGGYPKVILALDIAEKKAVINEIFQSYLEKDIAYLLRLQKTEDFIRLVKLMGSQIGNLVNIAELSRTLGLAQATIKHYLWYLQKTFILHRVTPFFQNIRQELSKAPVFYFYDLGLRNHALGLFGQTHDPISRSFLFENFIYLKLYESIQGSSSTIHFWRTKSGAAVDFVIRTGQKSVPVEVKYQSLQKPVIPRSLHSFLHHYQPSDAFSINLDLTKETTINKTKVHMLPFSSSWSVM